MSDIVEEKQVFGTAGVEGMSWGVVDVRLVVHRPMKWLLLCPSRQELFQNYLSCMVLG